MGIRIHIEAARSDRGLTQQQSARRNPHANPVYKMWSDLIRHAVQDAKRTFAGIPTDNAILARWWIAEHQPKRADRGEWESSFECACVWLDKDAASERLRLLAEIDQALKAAGERYLQTATYERRAMVLACAGLPTSIGRQLMLGLVSRKDYEDVAGIDHGDKYAMYDRVESVEAEAA